MSSTEERAAEQRQSRRAYRLYMALDGGLELAIEQMGGRLVGVSLRTNPQDVLATIRADFEGEGMIAFVGGSTIGNALAKGEREARSNALKWKEDRWAKK